MVSATAETAQQFETEACSRCGGSGSYSYCQMYGTRCFKCGGSGKATKRGQSAIKFLRGLRTVPAKDIQVGWLVFTEFWGQRAKWRTVTEVGQGGSRHLDQVTGEWIPSFDIKTDAGVWSTSPESDVMAAPSREHLEATRAAALQYQATLTTRAMRQR